MGASHVTLACTDIDLAVGRLRRHGYQPEFIDHDIWNHPSKRGIMQGWSERHSISLLRAIGGFPIELVSYPIQHSMVRGRYIGMFNASEFSVTPCHELETVCASITDHGLPCKSGWIQDFNLPVLISATEEGSACLKRLVVRARDVGRADEIWCGGLGFKCEQATSDFAHLKLESPVAAWRLEILLVRSYTGEEKPPLNAQGMACLAFLSTNVEEDVARLESKGAECVAEPFEIVVNGKKMKVAIVVFDGAYIELLCILT